MTYWRARKLKVLQGPINGPLLMGWVISLVITAFIAAAAGYGIGLAQQPPFIYVQLYAEGR